MGKFYTKNGKIIDQFSILKQVIDIREKRMLLTYGLMIILI
jgi:hypothetical protein